ncbi:hypothetical protein Tco_0502634 [Tanacetum coccineum]
MNLWNPSGLDWPRLILILTLVYRFQVGIPSAPPQRGLAAGIEPRQAGRCLTDLEAYIPSAEDDFNSAIRGDLRDPVTSPRFFKTSTKRIAIIRVMILLRLDTPWLRP